MDPEKVKIESGWKEALREEFQKSYFDDLISFIKSEKKAGKEIYPPGTLIFNAFEKTPFEKVKVVILGQDPYHNPGEAMGLCFSVPKGVRLPPSLKNIFREIKTDIGMELPAHGDLTTWAEQGVFLLNAMLTVEKKKAGSHKAAGWQEFTDAVIKTISDKKENVVFLLWGNFARNKAALIDGSRHLILEAAHPSPLARGAFFGSKHFSKTNAHFEQLGVAPINWQI